MFVNKKSICFEWRPVTLQLQTKSLNKKLQLLNSRGLLHHSIFKQYETVISS